MDLLISAATQEEVSILMKHFGKKSSGIFTENFINTKTLRADLLITGPGIPLAAYHYGDALQSRKYDAAIDLGICGAFGKKLKIGEVVNVVSDYFGDLGAEDDKKFLDMFSLGLLEKNKKPFKKGLLVPGLLKLNAVKQFRKVKGVTVNKVHGNSTSIREFLSSHNADVESMEGACFFYACIMHDIPCLQLRSVSNSIEKRNKKNWNIPLAVKQMNLAAVALLNEMME